MRTWNLFHGNAVPPERRAYLREMVELATADVPDVVCLQEVPVWALEKLEDWSGMRAVGAVGARPLLGSAGAGRWITEVNHGLLRSAVTGEGVAILLARRLAVREERRDLVGASRTLMGVRLEDGPFVASFHVTGGSVAAEQFRRVLELVPDGPAIVAGDVNLRPPYDAPGWSEPLAGSIDQVLVRGLPATSPVAWPAERRLVRGKLLSDHAPVELTTG